MDFKKCSEVYGYKSIEEVEEEELAERDREKAKGLFNDGVPAEIISRHYNIPTDEILSWKNRT